MKANPNSTHFRNFRSRNPNSKVASERLNQVGDLMSMLKPQTSVWGFNANSKVASERLNQVGDLMSMQKPQTSVWGFNANSKVASERLNQVGD
ncbi:MAG: hypothetical protein K2I08_06365, partial [Muribaculaceae bacterium]|nr:hypothetical protein [Muribaculaceae bacterium]